MFIVLVGGVVYVWLYYVVGDDVVVVWVGDDCIVDVLEVG